MSYLLRCQFLIGGKKFNGKTCASRKGRGIAAGREFNKLSETVFVRGLERLEA